jgi:hypothetical protein
MTFSRRSRIACSLAAALFSAVPAAAAGLPEIDSNDSTEAVSVFRESFTNGSNEGLWTFGNAADSFPSTGGNPGFWLRNNFLDTFAPQPSTTYGVSSQFTGDYRARGVDGLVADVQVLDVDFSAGERPLSPILYSDANTPDPADDCSIFQLGTADIPLPDQGWKRFKFAVPSSSPTMPPRWATLNGCAGLNEDQAWNAVIGDVDQVTFFFGNPRFFFIFQFWDVGLDNVGIRTNLP